MKQSKVNAYDTNWEYEVSKKKERKETKKLREQRKSKRSQWELVE